CRSHNVLGRAATAVLETWSEFSTRFPTEEECLEELWRRAAEFGLLRCRSCGCKQLATMRPARVIKCRKCNKEIWFTGRTFFHRMRRVRPWLAAIWFLEHGVVLSASQLQ